MLRRARGGGGDGGGRRLAQLRRPPRRRRQGLGHRGGDVGEVVLGGDLLGGARLRQARHLHRVELVGGLGLHLDDDGGAVVLARDLAAADHVGGGAPGPGRHVGGRGLARDLAGAVTDLEVGVEVLVDAELDGGRVVEQRRGRGRGLGLARDPVLLGQLLQLTEIGDPRRLAAAEVAAAEAAIVVGGAGPARDDGRPRRARDRPRAPSRRSRGGVAAGQAFELGEIGDPRRLAAAEVAAGGPGVAGASGLAARAALAGQSLHLGQIGDPRRVGAAERRVVLGAGAAPALEILAADHRRTDPVEAALAGARGVLDVGRGAAGDHARHHRLADLVGQIAEQLVVGRALRQQRRAVAARRREDLVVVGLRQRDPPRRRPDRRLGRGGGGGGLVLLDRLQRRRHAEQRAQRGGRTVDAEVREVDVAAQRRRRLVERGRERIVVEEARAVIDRALGEQLVAVGARGGRGSAAALGSTRSPPPARPRARGARRPA
ncbi:MAG: hypothetical protein H6708_20585 [Kofleriaceae bacterium]|nr:hypothetical protein [Kofleriaceae bacterium]